MRILSYNIHWGIGGKDLRYQLHRAIDVIEQETPDVICLQEVDYNMKRSRFDDQAKILAEHFGFETFDFQWNEKYEQGGYGNLILSRFPMQTVSRICLQLKYRVKRGAQVAVIDSPEGPFRLVHWHLGLAERQRHDQVNHLFDHDHFQQHDHLPTLIVGDFNDWRNQLNRKQFEPRGFTEITSPASQFRSFPAMLPIGSLDKAFAKGAIHIEQACILRKPGARSASDHLPLLIEFHLKQMVRSDSGNGCNELKNRFDNETPEFQMS